MNGVETVPKRVIVSVVVKNVIATDLLAKK
jgi:hypothetical protein